jgi:hypothetical protein
MLAGGSHLSAPGPFLRQPPRFDILSRRVPALGGADDGEEEREAADEIARLLGELNAFVGDFRAGVELLDYSESRPDLAHNWGPIACRDGALALIGFRDALHGLVAALGRHALLRQARRALRPVERRFAAAFPSTRAGRAACRASRSAATPLPRQHDDMCDAIILANVSRRGRAVRHRESGREIRFELTEHALWQLVALRNEAFAAVEEAIAQESDYGMTRRA